MLIFEYFFECYFNQSANYCELEQLVKEFYEREKTEIYNAFVNDAKQILDNSEWKLVIKIAKDKGGRVLSEVQAKTIMEIINSSLK